MLVLLLGKAVLSGVTAFAPAAGISAASAIALSVRSGDLVGELASQLSTAKHTDRVMSAERMEALSTCLCRFGRCVYYTGQH